MQSQPNTTGENSPVEESPTTKWIYRIMTWLLRTIEVSFVVYLIYKYSHN